MKTMEIKVKATDPIPMTKHNISTLAIALNIDEETSEYIIKCSNSKTNAIIDLPLDNMLTKIKQELMLSNINIDITLKTN